MRKLLLLVAACVLMGSAMADVLSAQEVEKIGGLTGVHTVPKNQATGAGGELNFAGADNKLVLMVMVQPQSTFDFWKKQYGAKGEPIGKLGAEAFRSRTGEFIGYVVFLKGGTGVWVQSMGWKKGGGANFTPQQLEQLARLIEPRV
ncbi:MAG: hypothetical protein RLZZ401_607 [Pseudomonadota bacterium]